MGRRYFTHFTTTKGLLYLIAVLYVVLGCALSILEPFITSIVTDKCMEDFENNFENPGYNADPCYRRPLPELLYLSRQQCSFGRRIVFSILFGGIIGWERRQADRPAGIRTMSLVSLGSCLFSICSAYAFLGGPENWDAPRISAAIPSGVGFLGAGLIWKQTEKDHKGEFTHSVHGLTTAASLWLSAGVGIACGGELYFAASFSVCCMMVLLRFGPRSSDLDGYETDESSKSNRLSRMYESDENLGRYPPKEPAARSYASLDPELQSLMPISPKASRRSKSIPSLRE